MKYIFITGGVVSGLGKGILAANIGRLLQKQGWKVNALKCDPYFLESPASLDPNEHGEVFVLDDGTMCDLDLGHYKRFIPDLITDYRSSQTSGKIYKKVIDDSAHGKHQGKTTQLVPHVSNEIIERFQAFDTGDTENEFTIIEIGGTVGDMESDIYIESIKQFKRTHKNSISIHLGLLPFIEQSGELKTKALQHSVGALQSRGAAPDILVCRNKYGISEDEREKLSLFCNIDRNCIIDDKDCSVYDLCNDLYEQGLVGTIYDLLDIDKHVKRIDYKINFPLSVEPGYVIAPKKVAIVGACMKNIDAYKSIIESLKLQQLVTGIPVEPTIVNASLLNDENCRVILKDYKAIIVPGGYGDGELEGKISALRYAFSHNIPCLGIELGFQAMCIEAIRSCSFVGFHEEFEPGHNIPDYVIKEKDIRLGSKSINIRTESRLYNVYKTNKIDRICNYKYEFNNSFKDLAEGALLNLTASYDEDGTLMACEYKNHIFYIGVQYRPELSSTLDHPEQLFVELIKATDMKEGM